MFRYGYVVALVPAAILAAACTSSSDRSTAERAPSSSPAAQSPTAQTAVPAEFLPACGKPGTRVYMKSNRATVKKSDCDLTSVVVMRSGHGGSVVPAPGRGAGNSMGFGISTSPGGTVSIIVSGEPAGNQ